MKKQRQLILGLTAFALATLLGLMPGVTNAQGPTASKTKTAGLVTQKRNVITDVTKAKKTGTSIAQPPFDPEKAKRIVAGLGIARFDAVREERDIGLTGGIENVSLQPITGVSYAMSKLTQSGWRVIKSGSNITINPKKTIYVFGGDTATNAMVAYKLEVKSAGQQDVKEFNLKARQITYVVKYETKGNWVLARYYAPAAAPPDKLAGEPARNLKNTLQSLGLAAKMTTKRYEHAFTDWEFEFWVYAQATAPLQRSFDNWRAAVEFRDFVRAQVSDPGLKVEILEK